MALSDRTPLYCQLANAIERNITDGIWELGSKIPSERELGEMFGMSRITVRKAVDELERHGLLERIQGKGTFVINRSIVQNLGGVYSFSKEMERQGRVAKTKLIALELRAANHIVAKNMGLADKTPVVAIERLRCAGEDNPVMLEKTYFKGSQYSFLLDLDLDTLPLYKTLEKKYSIRINKAVERFKACALTRNEAHFLDCDEGHYGLLVKRTSYCDNELICYSQIVSRGDFFEFTVTLES